MRSRATTRKLRAVRLVAGGPTAAGRRLRVVAALLVVLLLAEAGARVALARTGPIDPWRGTMHRPHLAALPALESRGGVDLLVFGSSVVGAGLDPEVLGQHLEKGATSYNFWVAGPNAQGLRLVSEELLEPGVHPRWLVIGLTSRELNDNGQPQRLQYETMRRSPAGVATFGAPSALVALEHAAAEVSALVRNREQLRDPAFLRSAVRGERVAGDPVELTPSGMRAEGLGSELRDLAQHEAQERAALQGFRVGGQQLDELRGLIEDARRQGSNVVLVLMPVLEARYGPWHPNGMDDVKAYRRAVHSVAEDLEVPLIAADAHDWTEGDFADPNHLNGRGAARLSLLVGQRLRELEREEG